jgi:RNA polymerase sigma-70 factor, ECF subfamily
VARPDAPDGRPSWDDVADSHGQAVYNLAYRLTGDPHDAADLAQDVMVRVHQSLDRVQPRSFDGWLYRVTRNLFLDGVRRRQRTRTEPLGLGPADHADEGGGPADLIERRMLEGRLEAALLQLPPRYRLAVVLCDVEGLSYEEVADATGWPVGTVRSRIHRGRQALRRALEAAEPVAEEGGRRG